MWLYHRICAITSRSKILAVYFGALALARLATAVATPIIKPPSVGDRIPPIPLDIFYVCAILADLDFMHVSNSIGTAFGT